MDDETEESLLSVLVGSLMEIWRWMHVTGLAGRTFGVTKVFYFGRGMGGTRIEIRMSL